MHLTGLNYQGQPLRQDWPGSQMHAGAWTGDDTEHVLAYIEDAQQSPATFEPYSRKQRHSRGHRHLRTSSWSCWWSCCACGRHDDPAGSFCACRPSSMTGAKGLSGCISGRHGTGTGASCLVDPTHPLLQFKSRPGSRRHNIVFGSHLGKCSNWPYR